MIWASSVSYLVMMSILLEPICREMPPRFSVHEFCIHWTGEMLPHAPPPGAITEHMAAISSPGALSAMEILGTAHSQLGGAALI